jgi:hypothetical protein
MHLKNPSAFALALSAIYCWATFSPASALPPASATPPSACYRVNLRERPAWISSAVFLESSSKLLVVDPFQNKLFTYGPENGEARRLEDVELKRSSPFYPTSIAKLPQGDFLLELSDGEMVRLDGEFRAREDQSPVREKSAIGLRVGSFYQWKVLGDSIIAYGSLIKGSGDSLMVEFAFFRVPVNGAELATPEILKISKDSSYFLLGNSYIATTDDAAYFVTMDEDKPAIYRVRTKGQGIEKLAAFPPEFQLRPGFHTKMTGPKSAADHFAELSTFSVASGLFAQDGMLYLLARKPGLKDQTAWYLYEINPTEKGKLLGSMRLPTSAEHLTVVPSKDHWFLLERGHVQALQRQEIARMDVIDSSAVATLTPLPSSCPSK